MGKIKVVELFAGVGGFRVGLEGYPKNKNSRYEVVWSNQWEPATKKQHANEVYLERLVLMDILIYPLKILYRKIYLK